MIKSLLICLLITLGFNVTAQIETSGHIHIQGTKVSIIPPAGFITAANFNGLQHNESGSSMMVVEFPEAYGNLKPALTEEALLSKGVQLISSEETTIDGYEAYRITGKQSNGSLMFAKEILIFGNDSMVTMVTCASPMEMTEIQKAIAASLMTIQYDDNLVVDPLASLDYQLSPDDSPFKFAQALTNGIVFTYDGTSPTKDPSKASIIATKSLYEVEVDDTKLFALNRLKQLPFEVDTVLTMNPITLDAISGYEITVEGYNPRTDNEIMVYQVILFSDNLYYLLVGITLKEFDQSLEDIKKLIQTFERK